LQLALTLPALRTAAADEALRALVTNVGEQPFLADAVVSGLAGREEEFVEVLARDPRAVGQAGDVVRFAVSAVLKSGEPARIERVLKLAGPDAPEWVRETALGGVRHFLPRAPDGKTQPGELPIEPKPLVALAARGDTEHGEIAQLLLRDLRWPGKPGMDATAARALTPAEQVRFETGKAQFAALCAACHQPNGQGLPGLAPSLLYSKWVLGEPEILARIVLQGKVRENSVMPPWKAALNDEAIASVLTFLRRSWGHGAEPVKPEIVAAARAATARREEPFSDAELELLRETSGTRP
jgi:mono/diheme cytochrome c family protein